MDQHQSIVMRCQRGIEPNKGAKILIIGRETKTILSKLIEMGFDVTLNNCFNCKTQLITNTLTKIDLGDNSPSNKGSIEDLDLPNDTFDVVVVFKLIEYLEWDRWAIQEIYRVLKPGGYVILTLPNLLRFSHFANPLWFPFWLVRSLWIRLHGTRKIIKTIKAIAVNKKIQNIILRRYYLSSNVRAMLIRLNYQIINIIYYPIKLPKFINSISILLNRMTKIYLQNRTINGLYRLGKEYTFICQKSKQPSEINQKNIFLDLDGRLKQFEAEHNKLFSNRNSWLLKNSAYSNLRPKLLDYCADSALVLSPHPDDEIIGCGGTLIKMREGGSKITIVQITDGAATTALRYAPEKIKRTVRLEEAKEVAKDLGVANLILWGERDSCLECTNENINKLVKLLYNLKPNLIFVPFINDDHPDHIKANKLLSQALRLSSLNQKDMVVMSYEVWSLVPANYLSIIDHEFDKKIKLLMKYRTAMKLVDYGYFCETLNAYHCSKYLGRKGFVEAFLGLSAYEYIKLVKTAF
jgi:N-acetylglucosamine malate deacetylase 1